MGNNPKYYNKKQQSRTFSLKKTLHEGKLHTELKIQENCKICA